MLKMRMHTPRPRLHSKMVWNHLKHEKEATAVVAKAASFKAKSDLLKASNDADSTLEARVVADAQLRAAQFVHEAMKTTEVVKTAEAKWSVAMSRTVS